MNRIEKLRLCSGILLVGFTFSVGLHYVAHFYFGLKYPFSTYLFIPGDVWADFSGLVTMNKSLDPFHTLYRGFGPNYPPFAYLSALPFTSLGYRVGSISFALTFTIGFIAFIVRSVSVKSWQEEWIWLFILCFLTYPFQFSIDRLNLENLLFLFIAGFYLMFKNRKNRIADILLGFPIAMKIYPVVLILLFPKKNIWSNALISLATASVLTVLALIIYNTTPHDVISAYKSAAPAYQDFLLSPDALSHSSSLFSGLRITEMWLNHNPLGSRNAALSALTLCKILAPILGILLGLASLSSQLKQWHKLVLVSSIILLLPPVSFDYKMTILFLPLVAFIGAPPEKNDFFFTVLFGFLLMPKGWFMVSERISIGVPLNIGILLIMSGMIVFKTGLSTRIHYKFKHRNAMDDEFIGTDSLRS